MQDLKGSNSSWRSHLCVHTNCSSKTSLPWVWSFHVLQEENLSSTARRFGSAGRREWQSASQWTWTLMRSLVKSRWHCCSWAEIRYTMHGTLAIFFSLMSFVLKLFGWANITCTFAWMAQANYLRELTPTFFFKVWSQFLASFGTALWLRNKLLASGTGQLYLCRHRLGKTDLGWNKVLPIGPGQLHLLGGSSLLRRTLFVSVRTFCIAQNLIWTLKTLMLFIYTSKTNLYNISRLATCLQTNFWWAFTKKNPTQKQGHQLQPTGPHIASARCLAASSATGTPMD